MLSDTPRPFVGSTTSVVAGMTGPVAQRTVTEHIAGIRGVSAVRVEPATGTVTVTASEPVDRAGTTAAVDEAGYALLPWGPPAHPAALHARRPPTIAALPEHGSVDDPEHGPIPRHLERNRRSP